MLYVPKLLKKIDEVAKEIPLGLGLDLNLRDQVILAYRNRVICKLKGILNESLESNSANSLNGELATHLESFLKENWRFINGTCLCYSVLQDDLALLLFRVAKDVLDFRKKGGKQSLTLLDVLMPGLSLESLVPHQYPHLMLNSVEELTCALKKLILGEKGLYGIPADLLLQINENAPKESIKNYYFDYEKHPPKNAFLDDFEMSKLVHQSPEAEEYYNSIIEYHQLLNEEDSLYSRLEILWRHLYYNSKNISGNEEIAGEGIYNNLLNFINYYDSLDKSLLKEIPEPVAAQIALLKQVASKNSGIQSCLATRQEELRKVIQAHEKRLKKITSIKNKQKSVLDTLKKRIEVAKTNFKKVLEDKNYHCKVNLGLTSQLIKKLKINIEFFTPESLFNFIITLTPEEIKSLGQDADIRSQILSEVNTIEDLVILFSTGLSNPQLESFIYVIKDKLISDNYTHSLIKTPEDLLALLIFLNEAQVEIVLNTLKKELPEIIDSPFPFRDVLKPLNPANCEKLCEILKDHLIDICPSPEDLSIVLFFLNEDQKKIIFNAFKPFLPQMVSSAKSFCLGIRFLSSNEQRIMCEILKPHLPKIIQSPGDFKLVLSLLEKPEQRIIFKALKQKIPELLSNSVEDFIEMYHLLKKNNRDLSNKLLAESLNKIIQSAKDFDKVVEQLTPAEKNKVFHLFKNQINTLIDSSLDLEDIIKHLDVNKRLQVLNLIKIRLPEIVPTLDSFCSLYMMFDKHSQSKLYEKLVNYLPDMIQASLDPSQGFCKLLSLLERDNNNEIYQLMKNHFKTMITSIKDFRYLFMNLTEAQLEDSYWILRDSIQEKILTVSDFCEIYWMLNTAQRSDLFETSIEYLAAYVKTKRDYEILQKNLNFDHFYRFEKYCDNNKEIKDKLDNFCFNKGLPSFSLFSDKHHIKHPKKVIPHLPSFDFG